MCLSTSGVCIHIDTVLMSDFTFKYWNTVSTHAHAQTHTHTHTCAHTHIQNTVLTQPHNTHSLHTNKHPTGVSGTCRMPTEEPGCGPHHAPPLPVFIHPAWGLFIAVNGHDPVIMSVILPSGRLTLSSPWASNGPIVTHAILLCVLDAHWLSSSCPVSLSNCDV